MSLLLYISDRLIAIFPYPMNVFTKNFTKAASVSVVLLTLFIFIAWVFNIEAIKNLPNPWPAIRLNSLFCFFLSGISLYFLNEPAPIGFKKNLAIICAWIIFAIGFLTLCEYLLNRQFGIDETFISKKSSLVQTGKMSLISAFNFTLIGIMFLVLHKKKSHFFTQVLILLILPGLLQVAFNYGFERNLLNLIPQYTNMALHSALLFIVLCAGIYYSAPLRYLKLSFQKKIAGFFFLAIIVLAIIFFAINKTNSHFNDTVQKTEYINAVLLQKDKILSEARDIETGAMRFIISGREDFLQPFNKAIPAIHLSIAQFKKLAKNNPNQQANIDSVEKLVNSNIEIRNRLIDVRREKGAAEASSLFVTGNTKELMDQLRDALTKIEKEEDQQLLKSKAQNKREINTLFNVIALFRVIIIVLLLIAFAIIYDNTRRRNRAAEEIKKMNEELENRVAEKTKEIIEKEAQYRFLLENMHEGIQIIGFDWRYLFINQSAAEHGKSSSQELIGHTMPEKYPGIENTELFKKLQRCMQDRVADIIENKFSYPDNSEAWFELSIQPVPEGLFILSMDITHRKESELLLKHLNETLEHKAAELQASNTELERFAYVASHDLQEPLRMISSFLHLLEKDMEGQLTETTKQYIYFVTEGANRMKRLIEDLLQYSRVGSSRENFTEVNCNELIANIRTIFDLRIRETGAILHIKPLPVISAVYVQLQQLFQNLVSNALKYYKNNVPEIEIGCNDRDDKWEFYVKDNGIGIDPKYFDKIFIIFQRLHNKTDYSGTGIGLAICKKIVEKHSGAIWVQSEPEKGSTFYFTIPKHDL